MYKVLLVALFLSSTLNADDKPSLLKLNLYGSNSECKLAQAGHLVNKEPFIKMGTNHISGCEVRIKQTEFFKKFGFCALSGIRISSLNDGCEYSPEGGNGEVIFYASSPNRLIRPSCEFICEVK